MVSYVTQCKRPTVSFVNLSQMFLDNKTELKIWLNLGLTVTIFRGNGAYRFSEGSASAWFKYVPPQRVGFCAVLV